MVTYEINKAIINNIKLIFPPERTNSRLVARDSTAAGDQCCIRLQRYQTQTLINDKITQPVLPL